MKEFEAKNINNCISESRPWVQYCIGDQMVQKLQRKWFINIEIKMDIKKLKQT